MIFHLLTHRIVYVFVHSMVITYEIFIDIDEILGTNKLFLIGNWIKSA